MYQPHISRYVSRLKNSLVALLFVGTQLLVPLGATGLFIGQATAVATTNCVQDTAGANDINAAQKDLTKLCVDYGGSPLTVNTTWNWDDTGTSGSNTLDACNLFDTNGNGNANYAVCVTTQGNPAIFQSVKTYSCVDNNTDRCASPNPEISSGTTTCTVSQQNTDPFLSGSSYPVDTQGDCYIQLLTVGAANARLIDVCSYPSSQSNSAPSDCVVAQPQSGKLEVIKHIEPSTDSGKFNLQIDSTTKVSDVSNNGSTGEQVVTAGNHSVGELAGTNSSLTAYNSAISCQDLNGTGTVVASGSGTALSSVPVANGSDVVCTITNTRQTGTVTLVKSVIEDNGGTAGVNDFGLTTGGTSVTSGQALSLNPGSYAINEAGLAGYAFVSISGTGCPSTLGGNVSVVTNQNITCTITNDDIAPELTVIKHVVNDSGGTAIASNFTMNVTGTNVSNPSFAGAESPGTTLTLNAGSYSVDEATFTGYAKTLGADCSGTISLGDHKTCTITNNDNAPTLTLVKHVTNDNGGTVHADQWTLKAQHSSDPTVINVAGTANTDGSVATTSATAVTANVAYSLSETGPTGYSPSSWSCSGGGVLTNGAVSLGVGENVTCTITNDDIAPKLTVVKAVNNNNGGTLDASNFPLFVTGSAGTIQVTSGTQNTYNAGQYTISETQQPGYTLHDISSNCLSNGAMTITLAVGGVYTCTLTNNDVPATITVTKVVNNNHGGRAGVGAFTLKVGSTTVTSGVSNTFAAGQAYTVSEVSTVNGYHQDSLVCTDTTSQASLGATFTPTLGEHIACTITNSDIAPQLTVIKHVTNDNYGNAVASAFTMNVTGTNVSNSSFAGAESPGVTVTLNAGSYSVGESGGPGGYSETSGDNCVGSIAIGEQKTCVITNDDIAPTLTIVKNVTNDNGGNNTADSFAVKVNGTQLAGGTLSNSNLTDTYTNPSTAANTAYTVSEAPPNPGYTQTSLVCRDNSTRSTVPNPVTLSPGQNVTCTIANDDVAPTLTVVKNVTNNDGGTTLANAFSLNVNGHKLTGGTVSNAGLTDTYTYENSQANTQYTMTEDPFTGYVAGDWVCADNDTNRILTNPVTLNEGQNVTCSVTNNDVAPRITVNKVIAPSTDTGKFNLNVNGNVNSTTNDQGNDGTTGAVAVTNGNYTVSETAGTGSDLSNYSSTYSCNNGTTGTGTTSASFTVGSGDNVTCTFFNTRLGSITIIKNTDPQSFQEFTFTGNLQGSNTPNFTLVDSNHNDPNSVPGSNQKVFSHLAPSGGSYTFGEPGNLNHLGWTLDSILCISEVDSKDVHNRNVSLKISAGQNVTCTFYNSRDTGTVKVDKILDPNTDAGKFNLNIIGETNFTKANQGDSGSTGQVKVNSGSYTVSETAGDNTRLIDYASRYSCTNGESLIASGSGTASPSFNVDKGDAITCTFTNSRKATIIVTKYNDLNQNGTYDPSAISSGLAIPEPTLSSWDISLDSTHQNTGPDGTTTFTDVVPGQHVLDEILQNGWNRSFKSDSSSNIYCVYPDEAIGFVRQGQYIVEPGAGDVVNCYVGNYENAVVNISKSNDRPLATVDGDTVTYSLVVTVPDNSGAVFDAAVTDLPPSNFAYIPGSWTANSSVPTHLVASDVTNNSPTGQPTYGSPGVWHLGNLLPGEKVTLTYKAKIGASVSPGTYPDIAFVKGKPTPVSSSNILGNLSFANTPFVRTQVTVAVLATPKVFTAGQVLGAEILVNTGTNLLLAQFALPLVLVAGVGIARRATHYKENGGK